jgi:glutamate dehydrogenase
MTGYIPAARQHLIDEISRIAGRLKSVADRAARMAFVRAYYRGVDEDDLRTSTPEALAAAAVGHLSLGLRRRPGEPLVRVFEPDADKDGWTSDRTIVEVVTDDMPFLVDSLVMVLNACGVAVHLMVHPVLRTRRDGRGRLQQILDQEETDPRSIVESWQHIEVDPIGSREKLEEVRQRILEVLGDVRVSVADWARMRNRALTIARELPQVRIPLPRAEVEEARAFLEWLADNHFTFLGYREYQLERGRGSDRLVAVKGTGLGLLRTGRGRPRPQPTELKGELQRRAREVSILTVTKANSISPVHRATYLDYVGVKTFDARGSVVGEKRFIGLFTSSTYATHPSEIPMLRHKVRKVIDHIGVSPVSHDGKALTHVLDTFPRDELFQSSVAELDRIARGIVNLYERRRVRLFVRRDPFQRFFSCLLFVPRDRYNTQARGRIEQILREELGGSGLETQVQISDSNLARLHTLVRTEAGSEARADVERIERRITAALRTWSDRLRHELQAHFAPERAFELARDFGEAFPAAYEEEVPAGAAIPDIEELLSLPEGQSAVGLQLRSGAGKALHLRLYRRGEPLAMSDLLPLLENFDLRVHNERPYRVKVRGAAECWIQDLEITHAGGAQLDPAIVGPRFEQAFFAVWNGRAESDGFNRLVTSAGLDWRQAMVLRAVCRYLLQTGLPFSQRYMESVLARQPALAGRLAWLFEARFDPDLAMTTRDSQLKALERDIDEALDAVTSPDDDRILRAFRSVMLAALRTNHYQRDAAGQPKYYLSIKLDPQRLPELPKPRPMFEIWVYSPRVEGVHLRMGMVARGGLRWSDRREDFRTEILGLMKAQNVKNTLIVPVGAKGGFVPKRSPAGGRDEVQREGVECYRLFIRGLLDLTDNYVGNNLKPPARTVRHDGDDPYLVVAADKGTATFSDVANALSAEYGFWLGDAFASGGSAGYDHKKMGITARGAWECVKRHFRELGIDIQAQDFRVAGIGDMAGDVFGNGMLLSRHIQLVAAFNHQHIFLDPDPDAEKSYRERERLFHLPRSSWTDYDRRLISKGGGIYARDAKDIALSPQARTLLGLEATRATPNDVIRAILKLPIDLLWNGGIGTYVKSSREVNSAVGDRSNDAVRVDGRELRCHVIGEGGNLGVSQLGRIEYALNGGRLNTDFVDNSGGVDCSDHEVNIKILLDVAERRTRLTRNERNKLLAAMTEDVAALVLRDNYLQSLAISLQSARAAERLGEHAHLMRSLELDGVLDRALEFLPDAEEIEERRRAGRGLTRPELAMVLSYSKIALNQELVRSDVPEDPYLGRELDRYFPEQIGRRYARLLGEHRLKREIIATATTNSIVNRMGPAFVVRTTQDTGADAAAVARAYTIAREIYDARTLWQDVEKLDNRVAAEAQYAAIQEAIQLIRHVTHWLLQRYPKDLGIERQVKRLQPGIEAFARSAHEHLRGLDREAFIERMTALTTAGVPNDLARRVAICPIMKCAPDVVELSQAENLSVDAALRAYFTVGSGLGLDWLRGRIEALEVSGHWQSVARMSLREGLYQAHRELTQRMLREARSRDPNAAFAQWQSVHEEQLSHLKSIVGDLRTQVPALDFASLSVALQAARRLTTA